MTSPDWVKRRAADPWRIPIFSGIVTRLPFLFSALRAFRFPGAAHWGRRGSVTLPRRLLKFRARRFNSLLKPSQTSRQS